MKILVALAAWALSMLIGGAATYFLARLLHSVDSGFPTPGYWTSVGVTCLGTILVRSILPGRPVRVDEPKPPMHTNN